MGAKNIESWLDNHAGWCEPYKARIRTNVCKDNRKRLSKCKECKGLIPKRPDNSASLLFPGSASIKRKGVGAR